MLGIAQKQLLQSAQWGIDESLRLLRERTTYGTKAKPTVKELNAILEMLQVSTVNLTLVVEVDSDTTTAKDRGLS